MIFFVCFQCQYKSKSAFKIATFRVLYVGLLKLILKFKNSVGSVSKQFGIETSKS